MKIRQSFKHAGLGFALTSLLASTGLQAQENSLDTLPERAGYTLGVNIGMGLKEQGFDSEIELESLMLGIRDALDDDLKLGEEEMMSIIQEFSMLQQERMQAESAEHQQAQQQFLADNASREGVVTTDSGLQYRVLEEGEDADAPSPGAGDTVNVHYHGTLTDGTVFDSSVERGEPMTLQLNRVIPGWTEGLQLMQVGDRYRFFIPAELAYGANGAGDVVGPNSTLIFDVELLGIENGSQE